MNPHSVAEKRILSLGLAGGRQDDFHTKAGPKKQMDLTIYSETLVLIDVLFGHRAARWSAQLWQIIYYRRRTVSRAAPL